MVDYNKLVGTRKMGDYGGMGTKSWHNAVNKQLDSQLPESSGSLSNAVKRKQMEKATQELNEIIDNYPW